MTAARARFRRIALYALACATSVPVTAQSRESEPKDTRSVNVSPYVELAQVLTTELSGDGDTATYTQAAAGVDASVQGRYNGGSASLRYERSFGYGDGVTDGSRLSGLARGYAGLVPNVLTIEGGALASRTQSGRDSRAFGPTRIRGAEHRLYSAYAGPVIRTRAGDAEIEGDYRLGYSRLDTGNQVPIAPQAHVLDFFDESVVQSANLRLGTRPGAPLPVGVGLGAGFMQEDVSNLDQRVRNAHLRGDMTVPLAQSLALVGGLGYEDVLVANRDAVRDAGGLPVLGPDGRFVTDKSAPRKVAFDVSGIIWDIGAIWRPSRRTSAEFRFGKRYGSTTYSGTFSWLLNSRSSFNLSIYDGISGLGGLLTNALSGLPTQFTASRNAVSGDVDGCVSSQEGGVCLNGVLGSVRSAIFRGRGIAANYSYRIGQVTAGAGAGYDRRKFIAAPGTVLAAADGVVDRNAWIAGYLSGPLDERSSFKVSAYGNRLRSDFANGGDATVLGASAAYQRQLIDGLSANAALGIERIDGDSIDVGAASVLIGLRYDF